MQDLQAINKCKITLGSTVIAGCAILLSVVNVNALDKKTQLKLGEMEYLNNCAACHGRDGKGGGPVAAALSTKPFDLTMISKRFDGKFPKDFIYKVIVGHDIINSHGETDMAVWGDRYTSKAPEADGSIAFPLHEQDTQAMILGRITSLIGYLKSIQAK